MKIVISGFYGLGNTGDEAILDAMIDNLRESLDDPDITVFSLSPEQTASKHNVKSIYRGWRHDLWGKIKALLKADLLLSGGGGLLQDTTPTRIIGGPLPYYLLIVFLAKLCGTKVMFFSQGIGPVKTPYGKRLMKIFGNMADFITVRDAHSKDSLKKLGVKRPDSVVTSDIVFAYQGREDTVAYDSLGLSGDEHLVGVSVRPWLGQTSYQREMAKLLDRLVEEKGITPVFVPMEGEHDAEVSREIISRMAFGEKTLLLNSDYSPNQYLQFIGECDMLIGMRLHSLIFAVLAGVPFVGVSYDKKVESLAKRVEMWDYSCKLEQFSAVEMYESVVQVYDERDQLREVVERKRVKLRRKALENIELMKDRFV
ncbi:polysaccharide pyruvyl transferase CsaB [Pontibacillus marinus]|uniref:Pyruvyl transferase n=1 Tax=Pontibacillus marinus BH030004 = DSM 16465 TaxID=1385511 RepID=A0A0A5GIM7_9BACI|nr:polysaccharide pyruvyl transferase CsaB [Pontibacillus marinus]KGX90980.1 pyruvyl transferase [Pontibacillus marinus BH030004 = DSM 16465]